MTRLSKALRRRTLGSRLLILFVALLIPALAYGTVIHYQAGRTVPIVDTDGTGGHYPIVEVTGTVATSDTPSPATSIIDGKVTGQTTSAAALATNASKTVWVQADPTNTVNTLIGNASSQSTVLQPGDTLQLTISNTNLIYCKAASGTVNINFGGTN